MSLFSFFRSGDSGNPTPEYRQYLDGFKEKPDMRAPVRNVRFVVLDTETTGLDVKKDRILSLAALEVQHYEFPVHSRLDFLLKQSAYQPGQSVEVHGISRHKTQSGAEKSDALHALLAFVRSDVIVGHHVGFDIAILNETLKRKVNGTLKNRVLDTSVLARRLEDPSGHRDFQAKDFSLDALCRKYHIDMGERHTAAGDVFITALLFLKLLAALERKGVRSLAGLLRNK